jgi:hypothetical protein
MLTNKIMKVKIEISCDDEKDLFVHLSVIRQQIRDSLKRNTSEDTDKINIFDSYSYGAHEIIIEK